MTLRLRVCVGVWWPCLCCRLNTSRRPSGTYTMPCQATWTTVFVVLSHTLTKRGWVAGGGQPAVGRHSSRPLGPTTMSRGAWCLNAVSIGTTGNDTPGFMNAVSIGTTGNDTHSWFRAVWTNTGRHTVPVNWQRQHYWRSARMSMDPPVNT